MTFPATTSSQTELREDVGAGIVLMIEQTPIGQDHSTQHTVTFDVGFGEPTWRHADRAAVEAAIGQPMPPAAVSVVVERATMQNSPIRRTVGEGFGLYFSDKERFRTMASGDDVFEKCPSRSFWFWCDQITTCLTNAEAVAICGLVDDPLAQQ